MAMPFNYEHCDDIIHNGYFEDKNKNKNKTAVKISLDD